MFYILSIFGRLSFGHNKKLLWNSILLSSRSLWCKKKKTETFASKKYISQNIDSIWHPVYHQRMIRLIYNHVLEWNPIYLSWKKIRKKWLYRSLWYQYILHVVMLIFYHSKSHPISFPFLIILVSCQCQVKLELAYSNFRINFSTWQLKVIVWIK